MQIEDEINKGILPNPAEQDPITGEPLPQGNESATETNGKVLGKSLEDEDEDDAAGPTVDAQYQKDTKTAEL